MTTDSTIVSNATTIINKDTPANNMNTFFTLILMCMLMMIFIVSSLAIEIGKSSKLVKEQFAEKMLVKEQMEKGKADLMVGSNC